MKNRAAIFLRIFGFFWSALTLLFDGFIFVPAVRQLIALRYPFTQGMRKSLCILATGTGASQIIHAF